MFHGKARSMLSCSTVSLGRIRSPASYLAIVGSLSHRRDQPPWR